MHQSGIFVVSFTPFREKLELMQPARRQYFRKLLSVIIGGARSRILSPLPIYTVLFKRWPDRAFRHM